MALRVTTRFAKIWKIEDGEYGRKVTIGTSRKKPDGEYLNCNWFGCRFVGEAREFGVELVEGDLIEIVSGQLENVYNKEKKVSYFNMVIFEAKMENSGNNEKKVEKKVKEERKQVIEEEDDEFPF